MLGAEGQKPVVYYFFEELIGSRQRCAALSQQVLLYDYMNVNDILWTHMKTG